MFYKNFIIFSFFLLIINSFFCQKAQAYLDPGSGSMILQMILAGIFSLACTCKLWFKNFIALFNKKDKNDE
jgi:hypothetical protein